MSDPDLQLLFEAVMYMAPMPDLSAFMHGQALEYEKPFVLLETRVNPSTGNQSSHGRWGDWVWHWMDTEPLDFSILSGKNISLRGLENFFRLEPSGRLGDSRFSGFDKLLFEATTSPLVEAVFEAVMGVGALPDFSEINYGHLEHKHEFRWSSWPSTCGWGEWAYLDLPVDWRFRPLAGQRVSLRQLGECKKEPSLLERFNQAKINSQAAIDKLRCSLPPNCRAAPMRPHDQSHWHAVIVGPQEGPYRGGVFKLDIDMSSQPRPKVRFRPPIHHCNVDAFSGEVGFSLPQSSSMSVSNLLSAISDLLITPDVSVIKNKAAFQAYSEDRAAYDAHARRDASRFWQQALTEDMKTIPDVLELFLPPCVDSRAAQHQVFQRVAEQEISHINMEKTPSQETKTHSDDTRAHIHLRARETQRLNERLHMDKLAAKAAELKVKLTTALRDLATLSNPEYEVKMEAMERKLSELYIAENSSLSTASTSSSSSTSFSSSSSSSTSCCSDLSTTQQCFAAMLAEAQAETDRLSQRMPSCLLKYESLYARFDLLKKIEEEKDQMYLQPVDRSVTFFVAHAKYLEHSFRSVLSDLVANFNRGSLPPSLTSKVPSGMRLFTNLKLASGQHAQVLYAPQKTVERVKQKIGVDGKKASTVVDYLRATIVMADPALLAVSYWALKLDTDNFRIKRVKNKIHIDGKAKVDQPPNVHINLEFRGHVGEIQLILEDFLLIKEYSHKPYELTRIGSDWQKAVDHVVSNGVYVVHPGKGQFPR